MSILKAYRTFALSLYSASLFICLLSSISEFILKGQPVLIYASMLNAASLILLWISCSTKLRFNISTFVLLVLLVCCLYTTVFLGLHIPSQIYAISLGISCIMATNISSANVARPLLLVNDLVVALLLFTIVLEAVASIAAPELHTLVLTALKGSYQGYRSTFATILGFPEINAPSSVFILSQSASMICIYCLFYILYLRKRLRLSMLGVQSKVMNWGRRIYWLGACVIAFACSLLTMNNTVAVALVISICIYLASRYLSGFIARVQLLVNKKTLVAVIVGLIILGTIGIVYYSFSYTENLVTKILQYTDPYRDRFQMLNLYELIGGIGLNREMLLYMDPAEVGILNYFIHLGLLSILIIIIALFIVPYRQCNDPGLKIFIMFLAFSTLHYPVAIFSPFVFLIINQLITVAAFKSYGRLHQLRDV